MNEVERILEQKNKLFRRDFLKEEIRSDFYIDEHRKKIWLIELDLLNELDCICTKYNLTYWLGFGSLLGAVRHGGFIPWDDDLDVIMPRKDYEQLQLLREDFSQPYFLQTPYTDDDYLYSYIKLRNSNTSCITVHHRYQNFNMGIALDIFCVDDWDVEQGEERWNRIRDLIIDNSNYMYQSNPNPSEYEKKRILEYSGNSPLDNLKELDILEKSCDKKTEYVCICNMIAYGYKKHLYRKEDFSNTRHCSFEDFEVPIPIGYDRILSTLYGDYLEFPPLTERGNHHIATFDANISYLEWKQKNMIG